MYAQIPIYQAEQIRAIEQEAQTSFALSAEMLMQRAGTAASEFLLRRFPQVKNLTIFCGSGNNGGDGFVLAHLAHEHRLNVTVWLVGEEIKTPEAQKAMQAAKQAGVSIQTFSESVDLGHPDVIVDAICGLGLRSRLRDLAEQAVKRMQKLRAPIFALDLPTGVNADTGEIVGEAVHATVTMTFIGYKLGLLTGQAVAYSGEIVLNDLQLPQALFSRIKPIALKMQSADFSSYLKPRPRDWHKGNAGHVLIVGGAQGYAGAPRLAGEAALRVGAGRVTVAVHPVNALTVTLNRPELMSISLTEPAVLDDLLARVDVIVLGPGLGQSSWSSAMAAHILSSNKPLILDADGLNWLAQFPQKRENWILTPHPGEASRLSGLTPQAIQQDRLSAVCQLVEQYGGIVVLKGPGTLVGQSASLPLLCSKGNPGMATAGMGDVLSGVIGGLAAQGLPLIIAAELGVYLHASAGDNAAKEGERGLIASDLMPHLRRLCNLAS